MPIDPPAADTEVTLTLPDREMLPGRVDVSGEGTLEVAVLATPRTPLNVLENARMFLEFVSTDGVCRLAGELKALNRAPRHTDQIGVWDVVRFTSSAPPMLLQRREFIRAAYTAAVTLVHAGAATECETVNVSGGGLLLRGLAGVDVGDDLDFQLAALDGEGMPIAGRCQVVRATPDGDVGVRFTRIDPDDQNRLVTFAYQRELAERERKLAA
jgi:PilZ domain